MFAESPLLRVLGTNAIRAILRSIIDINSHCNELCVGLRSSCNGICDFCKWMDELELVTFEGWVEPVKLAADEVMLADR